MNGARTRLQQSRGETGGQFAPGHTISGREERPGGAGYKRISRSIHLLRLRYLAQAAESMLCGSITNFFGAPASNSA